MNLRIETPSLTAELKQTNKLLAQGVAQMGSIVSALATTNELLAGVFGGGDDDQAAIDVVVGQLKANNDALERVVASIPNPKE